METARSMVSFDWAMKRLLRNKANFEVLEGFLSELLRRKIVIKSIAESESNKLDDKNKSNRVDILVEADGRELVIVELQYYGHDDYFQRMLYGVSKSIAEHQQQGKPYSEVRKLYSVNIVYFDIGEGDDYVYHGTTVFKGLHTNSELQLNEKQKTLYTASRIGDLYPEYYIIKVGKFNDVAKDTLDEWIYYLKNNRIKDDFTAQGIDKAREILAYEKLSKEEKFEHDRIVKDFVIRESETLSSFTDGEFKGRAEGRAEGLVEGETIGLEKGKLIGLEKGETIGRKEEKTEVVIKSDKAGLSAETISTITGLTIEEIKSILKKYQTK